MIYVHKKVLMGTISGLSPTNFVDFSRFCRLARKVTEQIDTFFLLLVNRA